jgi:hypothetical protein
MSLEDFYVEEEKPVWGSEVEKQIRLRIKLSIYAYAYEMADESLVPDHVFDKLCLEVKPEIVTGNKKLDNFFKKEFDPSTGQWIHKHPELNKITELYKKYYSTQT